eukprot:scaffold22029_cov134-Skeletonema_dohrnii-CCMP3373.AAC.4
MLFTKRITKCDDLMHIKSYAPDQITGCLADTQHLTHLTISRPGFTMTMQKLDKKTVFHKNKVQNWVLESRPCGRLRCLIRSPTTL